MRIPTIPLSRSLKQALMMSADALMLFMSLAFSFALLDGDAFEQGQRFYGYFTLAMALSIVFFARLGLYRIVLLYMGLQAVFLILQAVTIATALLAATYFFTSTAAAADFSVLLIFWMISLMLIGGSRFFVKVLLQHLIQNFRPKEPIIIYGAGSSGMQLVCSWAARWP